jgi:poly(A) polymerase
MMKHTTKIPPPDWMRAPETKAVMAALNKGGLNALFVGGCVRDALFESEEAEDEPDIDIATILTPEEVTIRLGAAGMKVIPTGIDHGTVTAVNNGRSFEITTLRKDVETDGRRAVVAFSQNWAEDAARRDFTLNTLLADERGRIYDPLGTGLPDLKAGRVVFVGDPAVRIAEDYLRILRFFRFYARFGKGPPDPRAIQACRAAAPRLVLLSRERITREFLAILNRPDPVNSLRLMAECGVLDMIIPATYDAQAMESLCGLQSETRLHAVAARLYLLAQSETDFAALCESLILSTALRREVQAIHKALNALGRGEIKSLKELIYRNTRIVSAQTLLLAHMRGLSFEAQTLQEQTAMLKSWLPPEFPLSGSDLKAAGLEQGAILGDILTRTEQWWIDRDFTPDNQACLAHALSLVQDGS